jgi:hypothetical protein
VQIQSTQEGTVKVPVDGVIGDPGLGTPPVVETPQVFKPETPVTLPTPGSVPPTPGDPAAVEAAEEAVAEAPVVTPGPPPIEEVTADPVPPVEDDGTGEKAVSGGLNDGNFEGVEETLMPPGTPPAPVASVILEPGDMPPAKEVTSETDLTAQPAPGDFDGTTFGPAGSDARTAAQPSVAPTEELPAPVLTPEPLSDVANPVEPAVSAETAPNNQDTIKKLREAMATQTNSVRQALDLMDTGGDIPTEVWASYGVATNTIENCQNSIDALAKKEQGFEKASGE